MKRAVEEEAHDNSIINISRKHNMALLAAIELWGEESQIGIAVEECGEFLAAVNQQKRGRVSNEEVCEEIADVLITMEQVAKLYGIDTVRRKIEEKIDRLVMTISRS